MTVPPLDPQRSATIARLARAIRGVEGGCPDPRAGGTGVLPIGPRSLVEWIAEDEGSGLATLALACGLTAVRPETARVLIDGTGTLHPPAVAELGIDLDRLLVVRPRDDAEALWAAERALRNPAVGLLLWRVDRLRSHQGRRARLAVEEGGGLGLLLRPWRARREACWADARVLARPRAGGQAEGTSQDRRWHIEVAYRRGRVPGETFEATLSHETGRLCVVPELAAATAAPRAS